MGKPYYFPLALVILSIIGTTVLVLSTRWGVGLSPDSMVYIGAARSLLSGHGLSLPSYSGDFTPMTHYPPLFSTWLAGMGYLGIDPVHGARLLNAMIFPASISLMGVVVYTFTRSFWTSIFGSVLMMGSFPVVQIHTMAWSEPLFIFFLLLGLFLMSLYLDKPGYLILAAASIVVACGFLTRYAGIALVATGVVGTLVLSKDVWRKRVFDVVVFCTISCFPMVLWVFRNFALAGTTTNREMSFHPPTSEHLRDAVATIATWLLPGRVPSSTMWITLLLVVALAILIFARSKGEVPRKEQESPRRPMGLPPLLGFFILTYGLLLLLSISYFDVQTPIDNRILSPIYVTGLALVLCLSPKLLAHIPQRPVIRVAIITFCFIFSVTHVIGAFPWLKRSYSNGLGYASRSWKQSALIEHIKTLDSELPIFTNGPDAVYMLTGRSTYMIPSRVEPSTRLGNSNYPYELATMRKVLEERNGRLVYFNKISWRWYLPSENELKEQLRLHMLAGEEDGTIYRIAENREPVAGY